MSDTQFTPEFSGRNQRTDSESSEGSSIDSEMEAEIYESTRMSEEAILAEVGNHRQRQVNTGRVRRSPDRDCMELQHTRIRLPEIASSQ